MDRNVFHARRAIIARCNQGKAAPINANSQGRRPVMTSSSKIALAPYNRICFSVLDRWVALARPNQRASAINAINAVAAKSSRIIA
jgi:hypothetical protein